LGRVFEGRAKYVPNRVLRRSVRRTLAPVRVQEAAELLALDIYTRAEKSGAHVLSVDASGPYPFV
jgi:hypothetical protein